jgi:putative FmdB family regulatory protein
MGIRDSTTIDRQGAEPMPIYEFECERCARRFEELVDSGTAALACPGCGSRGRRLLSAVSPPGRQPRGARARDSESRRREREAARRARIAEARKGREAG